MTNSIRPRRRGRPALALLAALALAGCEGDNLYQRLPTGGGTGPDALGPQLSIESPTPGSRVPLGETLPVTVHATDNRGLRSLTITAVSAGSDGGFDNESGVARFEERAIEFDTVRAVRDTVVTRLLAPVTNDTSSAATAFIIAEVTDLSGNVERATVEIALGGPRVRILSPGEGNRVRSGVPLEVRVLASTPEGRLRQILVRTRGAVEASVPVFLDPPTDSTTVTASVPIPASAVGELEMDAIAYTLSNDSAVTEPITLVVAEAGADSVAPVVDFSVDADPVAERTDSLRILVRATDSTAVDRVGVTVVPIHRGASGTDTLEVITREAPGDEEIFAITLADLGVAVPRDTATFRLEVTAFAVDTAGNCGAATIADTRMSESCRSSGGQVLSIRSGAGYDVALVHGATIRIPAGERIADIASNGSTVFLSNYTRNRVEAARVGQQTLFGSARVGSQPWGLAMSPDRGRVFVANSGGTNISVVSPASLTEVDRIETPNVKLFVVPFQAERDTVPVVDTLSGGEVDTTFVERYREIPEGVEVHDYSDRPQAIAQTGGGQLFYSTKPTGSAPDGTIRRYANGESEIFLGYLDRTAPGQVVIVGADSVLISDQQDPAMIRVFPRGAPASDGPFVGFVNEVREELADEGYDQVRFEYNLDLEGLGLSDTTFVAVSGNHGTIAFGEGARDPARIILFRESGGGVVRRGDVVDLINNANERVISLGLNSNGAIGLARGDEAYFFDDELRLQGIAEAGTPSGGAAMHPSQNLAFISGTQQDGLPFIDVVDARHFCRAQRIYIREPVIGPLRTVQAADGDYVYGVTARGVVYLNVSVLDLDGC